MNVLLFLAALCTAIYLLLLLYYRLNWRPETKFSEVPSLPYLSVIIPARNEASGIAECLNTVTQQNYPKDLYEILVIDDGSEDETPEIVRRFSSVRLLNTSKDARGKKQALTLGIAESRGELIVTTDADCIVQGGWLRSIADTFDTQTMMATGPVLATHGDTAFERFQVLDLTGFAVITASGIHGRLHHLANGANMAFRKIAFERVKGFAQNTWFASGDDVFLAQAIAKAFQGSLRYNWDAAATVYTSPIGSLQSFIRQRKRWATKNVALPEKSVFLIWALVWLTFVLILVTSVVAVFHTLTEMCISIGLLLSVAAGEYFFLKRPVRHFEIERAMKQYWVSFLIHYVYIIYIGLASMFSKEYMWKGRAVR